MGAAQEIILFLKNVFLKYAYKNYLMSSRSFCRILGEMKAVAEIIVNIRGIL